MKWIGLLAAVFLLLAPQSASATCVTDSRPVSIGGSQLQVRAYVCRSGNTHFRVEFHRLSSAAASVLLSGQQSAALQSMIGPAHVLRNDVSETFEDLLSRFGETFEGDWLPAVILAAAPGSGAAEADETAPGQPIRILATDWGNPDGYYYPAINELRVFESGSKPGNMSRKGNQYWRYMTMSDLRDYQANLSQYNAYYTNTYGTYGIYAEGDPTIDLMAHVGAQGLPEDFSVLFAWRSEGGCAVDQGWIFEYLPRKVIVDTMVVENMSGSALDVSALVGRSASGGLRTYERTDGSSRLAGLDRPVQPGERVVVATGIVFAPSDELREYTSSSYAYGPQLDVSGLVGNGEEIDFENRSANFLQMSLLYESGSCPFLMSWHEGEREWRDNGKILHDANAADLEYEESIVYDGFRGRFRLEEREPEVAYIDSASLEVELESGEKLELAPDRPDLEQVDRDRAEILWGERIEFSFALPEGVEPRDVIRSTLKVTGHYQRYQSLASAAAGQSFAPGAVDGDSRENCLAPAAMSLRP